MSFNLCRHFRLAGSVGLILAVFTNNLWLYLLGFVLLLNGYMLAIAKIERYLEEKDEKHEGSDQTEDR